MNPLFMWAGGKNKMIKKYQPYLPLNFDSYIEPFLGGGAMLVWAFENIKECEKFYVNDINDGIIGIYEAVKSDLGVFSKHLHDLNDSFIRLQKPDAKGLADEKILEKKYGFGSGLKDWKKIFQEQPSRRSFYYHQRDIHAFDFQNISRTNEAALLYFLMKTGFNGIWQTNKSLNGRFGTPCGLLNQKTSFFSEDDLQDWYNLLQRCEITCDDFRACERNFSDNAFCFIDPPYRGCFTNYSQKSDDEFQKDVIDFFIKSKKINGNSMLCNRELGDGFFEHHLAGFDIHKFDVTYTAGRRKHVSDGFEAKKAIEILIT